MTGDSAGHSFEREVFRILADAVEEGNLGLHPSCTTVSHRPAYFSPARGKEIVFDVAIELVLPGATVASILWIWECKDYRSPVPVDDAEEFHAKLEQIGADKTKGTIVTRSTFQESTITYARTNGIGLARILPDDQIEWVLHRSAPSSRDCVTRQSFANVRRALMDEAFVSQGPSVFVMDNTGHPISTFSISAYVAMQLKEWITDAIDHI